ncbi:MAG: ribokinase [Planctomycetes bacterium]|nr:ribokinase [Planctomycetota bacterium]
MKQQIVVIGSSNTDLIVKAPRIPKPGETVLGGRFIKAAGGKGANQAVAAARAGGQVSLIARIGEDAFGAEALSGFQADGIDTAWIRKDAVHASGIALIVVDGQGENSIVVAPGANEHLSPEEVIAAAEAIDQASIMVLQLEIPMPSIETATRLAADRGVPVLLNPAPAQALPAALLEQVSILTPNETEVESLTGIPVSDEASARRGAHALRDRGVDTVIITLGPRGVYCLSSSLEGLVTGFSVQAVDTTAAGDTFNGALAVALAEDVDLSEALRFAQAAAALSVTMEGAQPSAPLRKTIERFLADDYGRCSRSAKS